MVDQRLCGHARAEAGRLREAERQVLLVRTDYHTAIRRLHLAGGSLRLEGRDYKMADGDVITVKFTP